MADQKDRNIIIKKNKKHGHAHHGGAWKIAYADFVTAMMAFFLLMWLVASLNKSQKDGLADYFKQPLKISLSGGDSIGSRTEAAKGGGDKLDKKDGQSSDDKAAQSEKNEAKQLQQLKTNILLTVNQDPSLADLKERLLMDTVAEGLRIQLIDNQNKPMFPMGSDEMDPSLTPIFDKIAKLLSNVPNKITIQGHTDGNPFNSPDDLTQSNWELSTQRANAARRALVQQGMPEDKVMEVTGFASTVLLDKKNPLNPNNRRISIIVMKKEAENKLINKATGNSPAINAAKPAANNPAANKIPANSTPAQTNPPAH